MVKRFNLIALLAIAYIGSFPWDGTRALGESLARNSLGDPIGAAGQETVEGTAAIKLAIEDWESANRDVPVVAESPTTESQSIRHHETVSLVRMRSSPWKRGCRTFLVDGKQISGDTIAYSPTSAEADARAGQNAILAINVTKDAKATRELAKRAEEATRAEFDARPWHLLSLSLAVVGNASEVIQPLRLDLRATSLEDTHDVTQSLGRNLRIVVC